MPKNWDILNDGELGAVLERGWKEVLSADEKKDMLLKHGLKGLTPKDISDVLLGTLCNHPQKKIAQFLNLYKEGFFTKVLEEA
jgi:hypothetical protein